MGATIPAWISPGSINHVPFPIALTVLSWGVFGFTRESSPEKKVFLFRSRVILRYVHIGVAWGKSIAGAKLGIFPTPWHDTFRSSIPPPIQTWCPFSISSTALSFLQGKQASSKKNCAMPPIPIE
ncbi:hypothetical protein M9H77_23596 [Catharanthus roseus]|uniref:Uncharacterized protein n=1 Tax=Catharanthus roseus TaxID=4058 RepID=A0ACC0ATH3_CATRO|nr:hypothetical protein M9H77_23596 [Catharanthus roseus]